MSAPPQLIDSAGINVSSFPATCQTIMLLTDSCMAINQVLSPQRDSLNSYTQTKALIIALIT